MTTGTPNDDNAPQTFGAVNDNDLDFGSPALDSDAESFYSHGGFAEQAVADAEQERIDPGHLFASQPRPAAPAQQPAPAAPQPVAQPVAPLPLPVQAPAQAPVQAQAAALPTAPPAAPAAAAPAADAPAAAQAPIPPQHAAFAPPNAPVADPAAVPGHGPGPDTVVFGPGSPAGPKPPTLNRDDHDKPKKPKKRKKALVGGLTALTLVGGGGAFAAYQFGVFGAVGPQPAEVIPADAFAYVAVDFNPSATQKLGAYQFAKQFPDANVSSEDAMKSDVLSSMIDEEFDGRLTYKNDFATWVGDRAAFAALPAPETEDGFAPLIAIQVTDQEAAEKALAKIEKELAAPVNSLSGEYIDEPGASTTEEDQFAYAFKGEYVLLSDEQAHVDDAVEATATLDTDPTFTHDLAAIGEDQIARGWVNLDAMLDAVPAEAKAQMPAELSEQLTGSAVVGVHAAADYLEVTGKTFGFTPATETATVALTDRLPADADVAVEATGLGASLTESWNAYAEMDFFGIAEGAEEYGITIPDDIPTIFGTDFAAAATFGTDAGTPKGMVAAATDDPAASVALVEQLATLADSFGMPVTVTQTEDGYAAANDPEWAEAAADGTGELSAADEFTKAVPNADDANAFAFVRLDNLIETWDASDPNTEPLEAFGMSAVIDGEDGTFTLRLTTK